MHCFTHMLLSERVVLTSEKWRLFSPLIWLDDCNTALLWTSQVKWFIPDAIREKSCSLSDFYSSSQTVYRTKSVIASEVKALETASPVQSFTAGTFRFVRVDSFTTVLLNGMTAICLASLAVTFSDPKSMRLPHSFLRLSGRPHCFLWILECSWRTCPTNGWLGTWWFFDALCWCLVVANWCLWSGINNAVS